MEPRKPTLLEKVHETIQRKHYSERTEESYTFWIKRLIKFYKPRHPRELSPDELEAFLNYLAVEQKVSASTQNQALSALLFLYRDVLQAGLNLRVEAWRAIKPKHLPNVLTKDEVKQVIDRMSGTHQLMVKILYGSGLRLMECVKLRLKDLDFGQRQIMVRECPVLQGIRLARVRSTQHRMKQRHGRSDRLSNYLPLYVFTQSGDVLGRKSEEATT